MSAIPTLDPALTETMPPTTLRLPVGARFPRTWPLEAELAILTMVAQAAEHPARLFPVGRRFWRPTAEAIEAAAASDAALRAGRRGFCPSR